jgi:hypothetical protein
MGWFKAEAMALPRASSLGRRERDTVAQPPIPDTRFVDNESTFLTFQELFPQVICNRFATRLWPEIRQSAKSLSYSSHDQPRIQNP